MIARGKISEIRGHEGEARMPALAVGASIRIRGDKRSTPGRVLAARDGVITFTAHRSHALRVGDVVEEDLARPASLGVVALGHSLDVREMPAAAVSPIELHERLAVSEPMWTGIRAIDALLTIGRGSRVGFFGAPGAGKSTLLESIVRGADSDCVVIGLVGERGREAERWIDNLDRRTTIVCATSDYSPAQRVAAAHLAFAQARALAGRGLHVLLVLDSLARVAYALRELRSASGEPVGRGGYPPSVFAEIAQLVEGAGNLATGSVTLIATVLNDGDDRDPVSELARSLLDGHIQLSSLLAQSGHYPAIDILASASRTMAAVIDSEQAADAALVRGALALLAANADLRALGVASADPAVAAAVAAERQLKLLVLQGMMPAMPAETLTALRQTADTLQRNHGYQL